MNVNSPYTNQKYDFPQNAAERIVYVRPVDVADLPDEVKSQIGAAGVVYAVHGADGERLALVRDRSTAFVLARHNDLAPVGVH